MRDFLMMMGLVGLLGGVSINCAVDDSVDTDLNGKADGFDTDEQAEECSSCRLALWDCFQETQTQADVDVCYASFGTCLVDHSLPVGQCAPQEQDELLFCSSECRASYNDCMEEELGGLPSEVSYNQRCSRDFGVCLRESHIDSRWCLVPTIEEATACILCKQDSRECEANAEAVCARNFSACIIESGTMGICNMPIVEVE